MPLRACRLTKQFACLLLISLTLPAAYGGEPVKSPSPERFAKQIEAFAEQDEKSPPSPGVIVFLGSSSIRRWDLPRWFGDLEAINRGFGGSQISDCIHFAEQTALKYKPSKVVFFCGSNDIWHGKPPEQVADDFRKFTALLFKHVPKTQFIVLAVKPSPVRKRALDKVRAANKLIRAQAKQDKRITFLDGAFDLLVDKDGLPREELFAKDRLHLNDAGYRLWTEMVKPHLE